MLKFLRSWHTRLTAKDPDAKGRSVHGLLAFVLLAVLCLCLFLPIPSTKREKPKKPNWNVPCACSRQNSSSAWKKPNGQPSSPGPRPCQFLPNPVTQEPSPSQMSARRIRLKAKLAACPWSPR